MQFSIGELMAVFGIVVAFWELIDPVKKLKIEVNRFKLKYAISCFFVACFCIFFAAFLEYFHPGPACFLYAPIVWQMAAGLILLGVGSIILAEIVNPIKVEERNVLIFFETSRDIIESGNRKDLINLGREIEPCFTSIFDFLNDKDQKSLRFMGAISLLFLFSDKLFCQLLVMNNPNTVRSFFKVIIENVYAKNGDRQLGRAFAKQLLTQMFTQKKSILYREEQSNSAGYLSRIRVLVYRDPVFLSSAYNPLRVIDYINAMEVKSWQIKKYFEVFRESLLHAFLNTQKKDMKISVFLAGLERISEIINSLAMTVDGISQKQFKTAKQSYVLSEIYSELYSLFRFLIENRSKFPPDICNEEMTCEILDKDKSIYGLLAKGIYEIMQSLSVIIQMLDSFKRVMILYVRTISRSIPSISNRIDVLIQEKVRDDFDELLSEFSYPPLTAALVYSFGLCEPEKATIPLKAFLMKILKKEFIKTYARDRAMAKSMIPSDTEYDKISKRLNRIVLRDRHHKREESLSLEG